MLPFELTKDTPYLALSGELWIVFYEYFNRNWPCYKGFLLYLSFCSLYSPVMAAGFLNKTCRARNIVLWDFIIDNKS